MDKTHFYEALKKLNFLHLFKRLNHHLCPAHTLLCSKYEACMERWNVAAWKNKFIVLGS